METEELERVIPFQLQFDKPAPSQATSVGSKDQEAISFLEKKMKNDLAFSYEEIVQVMTPHLVGAGDFSCLDTMDMMSEDVASSDMANGNFVVLV